MLAHQAFFLLAVSNAISASEKDASNMAECHRALAGMSMTKHWLHPYLVVMRPSNGPAARVLCRWRQEQAAAGMVFVDVEIIEAPRARWTRARRPRSNRRGVYRSGLLPWVTNCPGRNSREVRFRRRLTPGLFVRSVPEAGDNGGQQGGRALMVRLQSRVLKRGHFDIRHRAGSP